MPPSSTKIEQRPSFEVAENAASLNELTENQGLLDSNDQIIHVYGPFANGLNEKLTSLGIRPDSPEILASIPFVNAYNSTVDGNISKTENYDFMIFQTQFDLTIKEIINKKIRNDKELQDLVLSEYRDTYSAYKVKKDALQSLYLTSINITGLLNIEQNTTSQIKNNSAARAPSNLAANTEEEIIRAATEIAAQEAKKLGVSLGPVNLNEFLDLIPEGVRFQQSSFGNFFFKNMCQYFVNCFFSNPYSSFSKSIMDNYRDRPLNAMRPNPGHGVYGRPNRGIDTLPFARGILVASRGLVYKSNSNFLEAISTLNNASIPAGFSYESLEDMARSKIGVKEDNTFNTGTRLIDKDSFTIIGNKRVEVFNSITTDQSLATGGESITGKQYFSRDVKDYLVEGNTLDLPAYLNSLSGYTDKIAAGLSKEILDNGFKISSGIIQEFGKILYDVLDFESFTSEDIAADKNSVIAMLIMMIFKSDNFNSSSTSIMSPTGESITTGLTILASDSGSRIIFESVGEFLEAGSTTIDSTQNQPLNAPFYFGYFLSEDQFESFQSIKKEIYVDLIANFGIQEYYDKIEEIFNRVLVLSNSQSYLSDEYVLLLFLNFCHELLKDFIFYQKDYSGGTTLIGQDSIDIIAAIRDLASGNIFENNSLEKILGYSPSDPEENLLIQKIKNLYKNTNLEAISGYNVVLSLKQYVDKIKDTATSLDSTIEQIENANIKNTATPSIESLTCLNIAAEKIYLPTSCFSPDPTFFTYLGSRNSKDMGVINSVLLQNTNNINKTESEETKVLAIGIPDGLIDSLRSRAGLSNDHTIIEISFYEIDHRRERDETEFHKAFSYYFNTCLHINTVSTDQNVNDIELITDLESFNKTVYIDNTGTFEDYDFNTEKILTFNFGKISNQDFSLHKVETFNEAIQFNKNYKINSDSFIFNDTFSNEIIRSHLINYGLRKKFEIFSGISFDEFNFPIDYSPSLDLTNQNLINQTASQSAITLINHFQDQDYTDDLKDYLARTSLQSCVINPSYFLNKSLSISKFERIFLIPAFKSSLDLIVNDDSNFDFKTLIPVVSII